MLWNWWSPFLDVPYFFRLDSIFNFHEIAVKVFVSWELIRVLAHFIVVIFLGQLAPDFVRHYHNVVLVIYVDEYLSAVDLPSQLILFEIVKVHWRVPVALYCFVRRVILRLREVVSRKYDCFSTLLWFTVSWTDRRNEHWVWELLLLFIGCAVKIVYELS